MLDVPAQPKLFLVSFQGYSQKHLKEGLHMLRETSWSTRIVEQCHASATMLHRRHPTLEGPSLALRAYFHSLRTLFHPSKQERDAVDSNRKLQNLLHTKRRKITARNLFCKDLYDAARDLKGGPLTKDEQKGVFSKHAAAFQNMSSDELHAYESRAIELTADREMSLDEDIAGLISSQEIIQARTKAENAMMGLLNTLSATRLQDDDLCSLDMLLKESSPWRGGRWRDYLYHSPAQPDESTKQRLEGVPFSFKSAAQKHIPEFVRVIAKARNELLGSVLCATDVEGNCAYYLIVLAVQSPMSLDLVPLRRQACRLGARPSGEKSQGLLNRAASLWQYEFSVTPLRIIPHTALETQEAEYSVICECRFFTASTIVSEMDPVPIEDFQQEVVRATTATRESHPSSSTVSADDLARHPWLAEYLPSAAVEHDTHTRPNPSSVAARRIEDADEDLLQRAVEDLAEKRKHWHIDEPNTSAAFVVELRGGRWSMAVLGQSLERFIAKAVLPEAKAFCLKQSFPLTASFNINKYGEGSASKLAHLWAERLHQLFALYTERNAECQRATDADLEMCVPDEGVRAWLAEVVKDSATGVRAAEIMQLTLTVRE
eukprot:2521896-Amphidinium_carterae.3